ncbi:MAG: hypothetical protein GY850_22275 [bacterium]|nr:hypothetical protein [bacterium]
MDGISGRKMPGVTPAFLETLSAFVFQFTALENRLRLDRIKVEPDHPMTKAAERWTQKKKSLFKKYVFKETDFSEFSKDNLVSTATGLSKKTPYNCLSFIARTST